MNKKLIDYLVKKYDLELLLLFGSRADNTAHGKSDFDVAYLSSRNLDLSEEAEFIVEAFLLFGSEQIDLVNLKKAPPLLYYAIFRNPKIIYQSQPLLFPSLRVYAFKKYIEAKPLYEEKLKRMRAGLVQS